MSTKSSKAHKTAKKKPTRPAAKSTRSKAQKKLAQTAEGRHRSSVPFDKIASMYEEGKSMEQIAKAVNRYNADAPDPTKSLRAIVSNMVVKGYKNGKGKVVKLEKRARGKANNKKAEVKKARPKPKKAAKKGKNTAPIAPEPQIVVEPLG